MTTYYVSVAGNDADNGLGPDASHGTNRPWRTWQKALGAAGIASADTVYLGPGVFREQVTVSVNPAAETFVLGDPTNAQGFKNGAGVLLGAGEVRLTNYLTDDVTVPTDGTLLLLGSAGFLTVRNIFFQTYGNATPIATSGVACGTNVKIQDCNFLLIDSTFGSFGIYLFSPNDTVLNWTIERCRFVGMTSQFVRLDLIMAAIAADFDPNIIIRNCLFDAPEVIAIYVNTSAPGAEKPGGPKVYGCFSRCKTFLSVPTIHLSATYPVQAYGNIAICSLFFHETGNAALSEDYNIVSAVFFSDLVLPNIHTITDGSRAILFYFGQEYIWEEATFPFGMPTSDSPLLSFVNNADMPTDDLLGETRPVGLKATGALEFHDLADAVTLREALFKGMHKR